MVCVLPPFEPNLMYHAVVWVHNKSYCRNSTISQADTRQARFCIIFAAFDSSTNTICPPTLTDTAEELANTDSAITCIANLSSTIKNMLDVVSAKRDFLSQAV